MRFPMTLSTTLTRGASSNEVRQVQELLNLAGSHPHLRPDGTYGGQTEQAVRHFQSTHALGVDGKVGQLTWHALERAAQSHATLLATPDGNAPAAPKTPFAPPHSATTTPAPHDSPAPAHLVSGGSGFCFPLAHRPSPDWKSGARYFGAPRANGTRLHAGCDLLGPRGTTIHAVADGTLVRSPYYFYSDTYAVEIRHGDFLIRYGEILGGSYIGGHSVKRGQPIAKIGLLSSGSSMLHFEMYSNGASTAPLTTGTGPYKRRGDLINASAHLDEWAHHLPV